MQEYVTLSQPHETVTKKREIYIHRYDENHPQKFLPAQFNNYQPFRDKHV